MIALPDGKHFWSCGKEPGEVTVWNIEEKSAGDALKVNSDMYDMVLLPDNNYIISGGGAATLQKGLKSELVIWSVPERKHIRDFTNKIITISEPCYSKDDKYLYVAGSDKRIRKFNMYTGKLENISRPLLAGIDIRESIYIDLNKEENYLLASVNSMESFEKIYSEVVLFNAEDLNEIRIIPDALSAFFTPGGDKYIAIDFIYKSIYC